jgi:hypothetical protein
MVSTVSLRIDDDHAGVRDRPEVGTARRAVAARADLYDPYAARCLADDPGRARAPALPDQAAPQLASTNLLERSLGEVRRPHHGDRPDPRPNQLPRPRLGRLDLYTTHATNGVRSPAAKASTYLRDASRCRPIPRSPAGGSGRARMPSATAATATKSSSWSAWPASMRSSECGCTSDRGPRAAVRRSRSSQAPPGRRRGRP